MEFLAFLYFVSWLIPLLQIFEWFSLLILFVWLLLGLLPWIKGYIAMTTVLNVEWIDQFERSKKVLELEVNEGREIDSASWVGVVEMLLCSCCESLEGIGVRREEDDSYLGVDEWFQALHSIIPTLDSFEDVGGLLLIKFLSKCVFWEYLSIF